MFVSSKLVSPAQKDGRVIDPMSTASFLATVAAIPVWATTVLPLSVAYQLGKAVLKPLLPKPASNVYLDSGYQVDPSSIIPREKRTYDVVVLGATGFTGSLAARHLAKTYGVGNGKTVKWAIAGRSQKKLNDVKARISKELGMDDVRNVDTIVVDTSVPSTLPKLVEQTRCVVTTAGPFALYGSSVVEFCAKFGTHYVDITGETDWVRNMCLQYDKTARETGAKIVSLCGHDSIPWDLNTMKFQEILKKECNDDLVKATFWDQAKGSASGGTIATMISAIEGKQPSAPAKDPFTLTKDGTPSSYVVTKNLPLLSIDKPNSPWDGPNSSKRTIPFVMAGVNAEVVSWSHALRAKGSKSLVYRETMLSPDFKTAFVAHFGLMMFATTLFNPFTRSLVKRYVLPKPGEGASIEDQDKHHFLVIAGEGIGAKGNRVESFMYFPKDPGYMETARMVAEAGLTLALEESSLPEKEGGFWTPSTAMGNILLKRLIDTGTTFETNVVPASSG